MFATVAYPSRTEPYGHGIKYEAQLDNLIAYHNEATR
jgi:hypothetical protein